MSQVSTTLTPEHFTYVAERTRSEDPYLAQLKEAAVERGIPPIWIAPEQASFLQVLLKASAAKRVCEVGTLAGLSAIHMARALPSKEEGGELVTIELDPKHAAFARDWIERSDVADRVKVVEGGGDERLAELSDQSFDAAFLDADKKGYPRYLEHCMRIVRPGGLILVDNAFAFGELFATHPKDPEVEAVREFNDHMAKQTGLHGVIVPLGDGMWVAHIEPKHAGNSV